MERDRGGVFRDSSRWWIFLNFPSADWRVCVCDETFTVCVAFFFFLIKKYGKNV